MHDLNCLDPIEAAERIIKGKLPTIFEFVPFRVEPKLVFSEKYLATGEIK